MTTESRASRARRILADAIAEEERLHQRYREEMTLAERWQSRADLARRKGLDEMAREATERRQQHERQRDIYRREYGRQERHVASLKRTLQVIETGQTPPRRAARDDSLLRAVLSLDADPVIDRFVVLEREDKLQRQLAELKARLKGHQDESKKTEE